MIELLSGRSPAVANDLVEPFARALSDARDLCGGDLDKVIIMLVIALRANRHPQFRTLTPAELNSHDPPLLPSLGTNVRSLSDATGIPKETVRRKVSELIEAGWILREGRTLHYSIEGYRAVAPARDGIIRMYARGFQVISALLDSQAVEAGYQ